MSNVEIIGAEEPQIIEEEKETLQPTDDIDADEAERVSEALLFASAEPLTVAQLCERVPGWADSVFKRALAKLVETYEGRGINLVERDGAWAFRTASDVSSYLTAERVQERTLSRAAMETLAIIAYHQPITRAEIENIRGVAVGKGTLDLLVEAGWVQPGRRRETPGRPLTWKTSKEFLDHFNLESLNDLPGIEDLKAAGLLDVRPAIETVPMTAELFDDEDEEAG